MVQIEKMAQKLDKGQYLLEETEALLTGEFKLASGRTSSYYFDSKLLTLHPEGAEFVTRKMLEKLRIEGITTVGGTAYGAIPIVSQIALLSGIEGDYPVSAFYHRKTSDIKSHGTENSAEGRLPREPEAEVAIMEDVVTTGDSLLVAINKAKDEGLKVTHAIVLLDRDEGGREKIEQLGYKFWSLFTVIKSADGNFEKVITNNPLAI